MEKGMRNRKRYDLPLNVQFRSTYGAKDYSPAVTTNISGDGLGLNAENFKFILYEYLELQVGLPSTSEYVLLYGDVVWKREKGKGSLAGIQLRMKDRGLQRESVEKIVALAHTAAGAAGVPEVLNRLGLCREYSPDRSKCRVTFRLPRENARGAHYVSLAGDFNGWNSARSPMRRLENGDFILTLELDGNRQYQFRYLVDGVQWENDHDADRYARNASGDKVSVLIL
jgi:hypothetical protein